MTSAATRIKQNLPDVLDLYLSDTFVSKLYSEIQKLPSSNETRRNALEGRDGVKEVWSKIGFEHLVKDELFPVVLGDIQELVRHEQADFLVDLFDIQQRIKVSAAELGLEELEDMVNQVGAYHLGAIQVLGFFLGLSVGAVMTLLS